MSSDSNVSVDDAVTSVPGRKMRPRSWLAPACLSLAVSALAWCIAYLWIVVPGPWFSATPVQEFGPAQMTLARGQGRIEPTQVVVLATDATGLAIVSLDTPPLSSAEYRRMRWRVSGGQPEIALAALWKNDSITGKIGGAPLDSIDDGVEILLKQGEHGWFGRISGIALTVRGTLQQPLIIQGVTLSPMSARDVVADRVHDWLAFRHWTGLSINAAIGGPSEQSVWLPLAVAVIGASAVGLCVLRQRKRASRFGGEFPITMFAIVAALWLVLDASWLWARIQQTEATATEFAGKTTREKHIADVDGYAYAFAEQVQARLPKAPARVFITADDHYFGARMAYHLYPHNAYVDHGTGKLPPPQTYKSGDYIVVFRRHNVQYDRDKQLLSWDDQPPVNAEVLLAHLGNAMFRVK